MLQILPIMLFLDSYKFNSKFFGLCLSISSHILWILPEIQHKILYNIYVHPIPYSSSQTFIALMQIEASVQSSIAGVC